MSGLQIGLRLLDSPHATEGRGSVDVIEAGPVAQSVGSAFRRVLGKKRPSDMLDESPECKRLRVERDESYSDSRVVLPFSAISSSLISMHMREAVLHPSEPMEERAASESEVSLPLSQRYFGPYAMGGSSGAFPEVKVPELVIHDPHMKPHPIDDKGTAVSSSSSSSHAAQMRAAVPQLVPEGAAAGGGADYDVDGEEEPKKRPTDWTKDEVDNLEMLFQAGKSTGEIGGILGRTERAVIRKLSIMKKWTIPEIKNSAPSGSAPWTEADVRRCQQLREKGCSAREIGSLLGKSTASVEFNLSQLRKGKSRRKISLEKPRAYWAEEEVERCEKMRREGKTWKEIAEAVGRTAGAIRIKILKVNEAKAESERIPMRRKHPWTKDEKETCISMWGEGKSYSEIAEEVGRTVMAVETLISRRNRFLRTLHEEQ